LEDSNQNAEDDEELANVIRKVLKNDVKAVQGLKDLL